jgi:hypothetical protein
MMVALSGAHASLAQARQKNVESGSRLDAERLRDIARQQRARVSVETQALGRVVADSGLVRLFSDSSFAAREWVGLRGDRPIMRITHNREAAASSGIQALLEGGRTGFNLSGAGQTVAVFDDGHPRLTHIELAGRVDRRDPFSTESTHATHVAGTIAATGDWREVRGMAPAARIRGHDWTNDVAEMAEAALDGVLVSNHSYGDPLGWTPNILGDGYWGWMGLPSISSREDAAFGFYGVSAARWDDVADAAAHLVIVKSAGNERQRQGPPDGAPHYVFENGWRLSTDVRDADGGSTGYDTIGDAGVAKNVITVGAAEDAPWGIDGPEDVVMTDFSSWGPVDDGRIKPDLVANGTSLLSAKAGSDTAYGASTGTSQAAPVVTGAVTLLQELWQREFPGSIPLSSTIKALLIHSADEAGDAPGPDYRFGWGHLNAERAAQHLKQTADADRSFAPVRPYPAWVFEGVIAPGGVVEYELSLPEGMPLHTTLAWTDPAGTAGESILDNPQAMLVHDLDLRVIQNNEANLPWVLDPERPAAAATRGSNTRDNVEQVVFEAQPGSFVVRIQAPASMARSEQTFSLIVGSAVNQPDLAGTSTVSGTVRLGNTPIPDINIRLSGPVVRGSRTGNDGVFMVDELPPGSYTVSADPSLFDIEPSSIEVTLPVDAGRIDFSARSRTRTDEIRIFESTRLLQTGEQSQAVDVSTVPAGGLVGVELMFVPHPGVDLAGSSLVLDTDHDPHASPWSGVDARRLADLSMSQALVRRTDGRLQFRIPVLWIDGSATDGSRVEVPFEIRHGASTGPLVLADTLFVPVSGRDFTGPYALASVRNEGISHADIGSDLEIRASFLDGSPISRAEAILVDRFDTTRVLATMPLKDSGDLVADLDYIRGDGVYSARFYPNRAADYQLRVSGEDALGNVTQRLLPAFYSSSSFDPSGSMLLLAEENGISRTNTHLALLDDLGESPAWWEQFVRGTIPSGDASGFDRIWMARLGRPLDRDADVAIAEGVLGRGGSLHLFSRQPVRGENAENWLRSSTGIEMGPVVSVDSVRGAGPLRGLFLKHAGPAPRSLVVPSNAEPLLTSGSHVLAARSGNAVISTVGVGSLQSEEADAQLLAAMLYEERGSLAGIGLPGDITPRPDTLRQAQTDSIRLAWNLLPWANYAIEVSTDSLFASTDFAFETVDDHIVVGPLERGARYHWRVRGTNPAGTGAWNEPRVFLARPANQAPMTLVPEELFETGTGKGRTYFGYGYFFADPDRDRMTFTATTSNPDIISVEYLESGIYLLPGQAGSASVRLRATDPDGLWSEALITVDVAPNRSPSFTDWPSNPQYITPGTTRSWSLESLIDEPDGDSLQFWIFNQNSDVAEVSATSTHLELQAHQTGLSYLGLLASDGRGAQIDTSFVILVRVNTPPQRNPRVNPPEFVPGDSISVYLPVFFTDPEEDPIHVELLEASEGLRNVVVRDDSLFARLVPGPAPSLSLRVFDSFESSIDVVLPLTLNAAAALRTDDGTIPERFETGATYPQPFSGRVTIPFALPSPARVRLDIYDSLGRHVARIVDRSMQAGSHRLDWVPPAGLPGGNYYYQLRAGTRIRSGILVFVP